MAADTKAFRDMAAHEIFSEASKRTESIPIEDRTTFTARSAQAEIGVLKYAIGQLVQYRDDLKAGPVPKEQHVNVNYCGVDWQVTFDDDGEVTGYCVAGQELYDFLTPDSQFAIDERAQPLIDAVFRELASDAEIDRFEAQRDLEAA